ncbi:polyketide synthase dehydratase domain-containing protein, partial [Actinoalloteichus caeruleus]|uniref:polyketide synthase dehydratase domain-containing protein n=1 Tax=Actinoalloteichus cyanogriseus TaxID=2893586 RepID=UPI001B80E7E2
MSAVGLRSADHPLLGTAVGVARTDEFLFTGRLSLESQPWLAGHVVGGSVLVPGTAFVELVLRAGEQAGCGVVDDLTLETPLLLPERGGVAVQVFVAAPDEDGHRAVTVHSCADDEEWVRHASGVVGAVVPPARALDVWPPENAASIDVEELYDGLQAAGLAYGPEFRGVRSLWRRDDEVFAEVVLPEGLS